MRPALVLLDRDGVINHDSADYILSADAWQPLPGSLEAIARLTAAHIPVAICTNQSAIGRGWLDEATLADIHDKLLQAVAAAGGAIRAIHYCPHAPEANCHCRKPAPGLIEQALQAANVSAHQGLMIGDSERDLIAAQNAGVKAWLVRTGNGQTAESKLIHRPDIPVFDDLAEATDVLLGASDAE